MRGLGFARWRFFVALSIAFGSGSGCAPGDDGASGARPSAPTDAHDKPAASMGIPGGMNAPPSMPASSGAAGQASDNGSASPPPMPAGGAPEGTFKPRADLDPNMQFDWPETSPGQSKCQPGTYVGMFACSLFVDPTMPPPDGTPPDFSGPITLEFKKSADGEFLELANAKLDGSANDTLGFMADLNGRLDCNTLEFTATVSNGVYGLGSPILLPTGDVNGMLMGMLDLSTGQLSGTWSLFSMDAMDFTCDGPWQATFTP